MKNQHETAIDKALHWFFMTAISGGVAVMLSLAFYLVTELVGHSYPFREHECSKAEIRSYE